ncbi:uncharacterized protein [Oscarella lobularis]|uniref:uncharacterized protein n=1 Tax=Oscarella lobularis TaxID=121494 RepID=UPI0033143C75
MFLMKTALDDVVVIESPAKKRRHNSDVPGSGDSSTVDDDISVNYRRSKRLQASSSYPSLSPKMKLNFDSISVDERKKKSSKIPVLKKKRIIRFSGKHYKAYEPIGKKKFVVSTLSPGKSLLKNKDPGPLSPLEKRRRRIRARLNAKLD